jgi:16S rRNA (cytosine967-C5)-methyltransferase
VKTESSPSKSAVSPARAAAFDVLLRVERESSYASELLHARTLSALSAADHGLTTELVMGVLRWRALLDSRIAESSSQPLARLDREVLTALRLAVYQFAFLSRIPHRAALNESVELVKRARKRSAAPFVNAVLRKLSAKISADFNLEAPAIVGDSPELLSASSSHPLWLVERWVQAYGLEAARGICIHNQSVPVTSIRLRHVEAEGQLRDEHIDLVPGALLASARNVRHGDVTKTAAFRSGSCVIQDEASQLIPALLGRGENILDCCAAPGGKTLALADRNPGARIVAADLHPHRARLLRRLLHAHDPADCGGKIYVIAADARNLPLGTAFESVLVDAPCSGTGTLARNPEIKWTLSAQDFADLQLRQSEILRAAMRHVAGGGRLIYSTCSLEREENEDVIALALAHDTSLRLIDCGAELSRLHQEQELIWHDLPSLTRGPYLRTVPGVHHCDGFFAAILEKT